MLHTYFSLYDVTYTHQPYIYVYMHTDAITHIGSRLRELGAESQILLFLALENRFEIQVCSISLSRGPVAFDKTLLLDDPMSTYLILQIRSVNPGGHRMTPSGAS